ncbi:MAG: cystathionine beta-lyase [Bacteroidetes bacterium GWA2_30_7]|nr:MAG: cystathionine beta-lyase [Bacteroidetes bacterium GWA2_30_7]
MSKLTRYNFDEIINREKTNSVKYDLRSKLFGKADVIPMWVADMDFKTPDFIVEAIRKRTEHEIFGYTFRSEGFCNSIINWIQKRHGWTIEKEWISFSPGVVPALNILVQSLTKPGDKIIVQPPVYFPFFGAVENNGRKMVENQLKLVNGRYEIDFEHLESVIDTDVKMLLFCSPHNPCSRVWTKEELEKIGDICLKNNILIVSDEIHSDLVFKPNKHFPTASISKQISDITITCIAPSKTFNLAGLHTSAVICRNKELLKKYNKFLEDFHLSGGNIFGFEALEAAYNQGDGWLNQLLEYLQSNINFVDDYLQQNIPKIKLIKPEATFLLWLDFRELKLTNKEIKKLLIEKAGVALFDGRIFGKGGEGFQRMNIGCPKEVLEKVLINLKVEFTK